MLSALQLLMDLYLINLKFLDEAKLVSWHTVSSRMLTVAELLIAMSGLTLKKRLETCFKPDKVRSLYISVPGHNLGAFQSLRSFRMLLCRRVYLLRAPVELQFDRTCLLV